MFFYRVAVSESANHGHEEGHAAWAFDAATRKVYCFRINILLCQEIIETEPILRHSAGS